MTKKRNATKAEKEFMSQIAALGCIVDVEVIDHYTGFVEKVRCEMPAEIHHPRGDVGMSQRAAHEEGLPLCHKHHRTGGFGVAFHAGKGVWQKTFGTEKELLEKRNILLGII